MTGRSAQDKLLALYNAYRSAYLTLDAVGESKEFTENSTMINRAISLMPLLYAEPFAEMRQDKEETYGEGRMPNKDLYALFDEYMQKKKKTIVGHLGTHLRREARGGDGARAGHGGGAGEHDDQDDHDGDQFTFDY